MATKLTVIAAIALIFAGTTAHALVLADPSSLQGHQRLASTVPFARVGELGGGVAVSGRWIVTAAHVADSVIPGVTRVEVDGLDYAVWQAVIPDRYSPPGATGIASDIALLGLAKAISTPIAAHLACDRVESGSDVVIVGAGDVRDRHGMPVAGAADGTLLAGRNRVARADADWVDIQLDRKTDEAMWAVSAGGDSGGPMLRRLGDRWQVVAVSSHYPDQPDRHGNRTDRYTNVASHCAWIRQVIGNAPSEPATSASAVALTSAGDALAEQWIQAYNSGFDQIAAFNRDKLSRSMAGQRDIEQQRRRYAALFDQWGPLAIVEVRDGMSADTSMLVVNSELVGRIALIFSFVEEQGLKLDAIASVD